MLARGYFVQDLHGFITMLIIGVLSFTISTFSGAFVSEIQ